MNMRDMIDQASAAKRPAGFAIYRERNFAEGNWAVYIGARKIKTFDTKPEALAYVEKHDASNSAVGKMLGGILGGAK